MEKKNERGEKGRVWREEREILLSAKRESERERENESEIQLEKERVRERLIE